MRIGQTPFILSPPGYSLDLSHYRFMDSLKYMRLFATFIGCRLIRLKVPSHQIRLAESGMAGQVLVSITFAHRKQIFKCCLHF
jgi:hypothetical protein